MNKEKQPEKQPEQKQPKKCIYCENTYSTSGSLTRHMKACPSKNTMEEKYKQKIKKLETELQYYKKLDGILIEYANQHAITKQIYDGILIHHENLNSISK